MEEQRLLELLEAYAAAKAAGRLRELMDGDEGRMETPSPALQTVLGEGLATALDRLTGEERQFLIWLRGRLAADADGREEWDGTRR